MNTPTHLLVAAALIARPGRRQVNRSVVFGALVPDLSLYLLVAAAAAQGNSLRTIFDQFYFSESWQTVFAIDNSAPLYAALLLAGLVLRWPVLWAFAAGALLHVALDLPLHHDDGRPHFWPITDWVYASPVSYWDTDHYAWIVAPLEIALMAALSVLLWRRFRRDHTPQG